MIYHILLIVLVGWPSSSLLWHRAGRLPLTLLTQVAIAVSFGSAVAMSVATWWFGMRSGVRALEGMGA